MTSAPAAPISLAEVLAYRHPGVIRRYVEEQHASPAEAEEVFRETLKWLYLCYRSTTEAEGFDCSMTPEIGKIDDMWHTFILFTRDYADFCERCFGLFLHHAPIAEDESEPQRPDEVRHRLERQFGLIYDVLGEETLTAWYDERRHARSTASA